MALRASYSRKDEPFLVFDTETTVDPTQALRFGAFAFGILRKDGMLTILERGLFLADNPVSGDENGMSVIARYALENGMLAMSTQQFCERFLWKYCNKADVTLVGANLPFDISRIAVRAVESRKLDDAFSFRVFRDASGREYGPRPSITVKKLGPKKQIIQWGTSQERKFSHGAFIDVLQAVAAHNGGQHFSLGKAAELYGTEHRKSDADYTGPITPEYLSYCVNDIMVTAEIFQAVSRQHAERKSGTPLKSVFSTASLSKALMDDLGVIPPLTANPGFPSDILGMSMASFIGARTEAHIVNTAVPGQLLDFTSMYPTVGSLMDLTRFLRAERLEAVDATEEIRELLSRVTLDGCFDRSMWPGMCGVAMVAAGQTLTVPVRAEYGGSGTQVSLSHFTPLEPIPYAIPDLVAACLLDGHAPEITRAYRLEPVGRSGFLRRASLPGNLSLDLRKDDLFRTLVEMRNGYKAAHSKGHGSELACIESTECKACSVTLYLKILANALYGIFAELNQAKPSNEKAFATVGKFTTTPGPETFSVYAHGKPVHGLKVDKPELPGRFCFPPIATLFTSGARLMLAMLEKSVTNLGGTYAMMDTDSMFIVSREAHGPIGDGITGLSADEVSTIAGRFQRLSPYSKGIELLKREYPKQGPLGGLCMAISSKRYALFGEDGKSIAKKSEHGLGFVKSPAPGWRDDAWGWIIASKLARLAGDPEPPLAPDWFEYPAIGQLSISTPWLSDSFRKYNDGKPYQDQIKPYCFMSVAYRQTGDFDRSRVRLVAPFINDVASGLKADWFDIYTGNPVDVATRDNPDSPGAILIKSYAGIMHAYLRHAEVKAGSPAGTGQATARTVGELTRLNVVQALPAKIQGTDMNNHDEQEAHLLTADDVTLTYTDVDVRADVRTLLESTAYAGTKVTDKSTGRAAVIASGILREHGVIAGDSKVAIRLAADIARGKA
jgi:hypothetical protein